MNYIKVIDLGHVIEVYEMERIPVNPHEIEKKDGYSFAQVSLDEETTLKNNRLFYEEQKENIKHRKDRKEERRSQTVRDARNRCRRLALMNFSEKDTFMTLTFAENIQDVQYADNEFKKFMKRFNYKYNRKSKFLAVREFQKRGAIHYHLLIDWKYPSSLEKEGLRALERELGVNTWGHGFVNLKPLKSQKKGDKPVDNVGAYLIKYMTKDLYEKKLSHNKLYLCSKGIKRPLVYIQDEARNLLKVKGIDCYSLVFHNEYNNDFLGNIYYKEYNSIRKNPNTREKLIQIKK